MKITINEQDYTPVTISGDITRLPSAPIFKSSTGTLEQCIAYDPETKLYQGRAGKEGSMMYIICTSSCIPDASGLVTVYAMVSAKYRGGWFKSTKFTMPEITYRAVGLLGIVERIQTNCRDSESDSFPQACQALSVGGFMPSVALSWLKETAEERAIREAAEKVQRIETEFARAIKIFLATKGISKDQKDFINSLTVSDLPVLTNLYRSQKLGVCDQATRINAETWTELAVYFPAIDDNDLI